MTPGQWFGFLEGRLSTGEEVALMVFALVAYLLIVRTIVGAVRWLGRRQWPTCAGCGRRVPPDAGLHLCEGARR